MSVQKGDASVEGRISSSSSPWTKIGLAFLVLVVAFGGEFFVDKGLSAFLGEDPTVTRKLLFFVFSLVPKVILPLVIAWRGESWRNYVGKMKRTSWFYVLGGLTFFSLGFRLLGMEISFPRIFTEFNYLRDLANGGLAWGILLIAGQYIYYLAEGVVMVYVIVQGSEAVADCSPSWAPGVYGLLGGLLLGLTWGLIHFVSQGSFMAGLFGLIISIPLGFFYGKTGSGLVPWLIWMGFMTL